MSLSFVELKGYLKQFAKVLPHGGKARSTAELFMAMPGDKKEMIGREIRSDATHVFIFELEKGYLFCRWFPGKTSGCSTKSKVRHLQVLILNSESLQNEYGDQGRPIVLAVDPGIKDIATAAFINSHAPKKSWGPSLPKGCHPRN
ncbi:hypothetical protein BGX21_007853 [Mortierella sp. AD011]|nr:hypothetical protein BGX20_009980 [Mortierella sp. AD010]KAF9402970.1 hypothetical protein BGX21_007853 [Mortierella sp. AD011]